MQITRSSKFPSIASTIYILRVVKIVSRHRTGTSRTYAAICKKMVNGAQVDERLIPVNHHCVCADVRKCRMGRYVNDGLRVKINQLIQKLGEKILEGTAHGVHIHI